MITTSTNTSESTSCDVNNQTINLLNEKNDKKKSRRTGSVDENLLSQSLLNKFIKNEGFNNWNKYENVIDNRIINEITHQTPNKVHYNKNNNDNNTSYDSQIQKTDESMEYNRKTPKFNDINKDDEEFNKVTPQFGLINNNKVKQPSYKEHSNSNKVALLSSKNNIKAKIISNSFKQSNNVNCINNKNNEIVNKPIIKNVINSNTTSNPSNDCHRLPQFIGMSNKIDQRKKMEYNVQQNKLKIEQERR